MIAMVNGFTSLITFSLASSARSMRLICIDEVQWGLIVSVGRQETHWREPCGGERVPPGRPEKLLLNHPQKTKTFGWALY